MNSLICLIYLGVSVISSQYTLTDLIRWIREGRLSYFNADRFLPDDMKTVNTDHNVFTHLVSVAPLLAQCIYC